MPELPFVTLDVFTRVKYAGNPLALVLVPAGQDVPSTEQMQLVAREFNLSETVFLHQAQDGTHGVPEWRMRIFLTDAEVPFAGHPTIGTACYALGTLAHNARRGRFVCNAGPIDVHFADGMSRAAIPHNVHVHTQYPFSAEQLHQLQPCLTGKVSSDALAIVSPVKGMSFVMCELSQLASLAKVQLGRKPEARLDDEWNVGFVGSYFYVIEALVLEDGQLHATVHTRMIEGMLEDPATGSAACALGAFLALKHKASAAHFEITQGVHMGRKSDIVVSVYLKDSAAVERIELSGTAVKVQAGTIEL